MVGKCEDNRALAAAAISTAVCLLIATSLETSSAVFGLASGSSLRHAVMMEARGAGHAGDTVRTVWAMRGMLVDSTAAAWEPSSPDWPLVTAMAAAATDRLASMRALLLDREALQGGVPCVSSHSTTPKLYTSAAGPSWPAVCTSGPAYLGAWQVEGKSSVSNPSGVVLAARSAPAQR